MPNAGKGGQPTKKGMYARQGKRIQGPGSLPLQLRVTSSSQECLTIFN